MCPLSIQIFLSFSTGAACIPRVGPSSEERTDGKSVCRTRFFDTDPSCNKHLRLLYFGTCSNWLKFVVLNMFFFQQFHIRLSCKTDMCPLSIRIFQSSSTGACIPGSDQVRRNEQTERVCAVYASFTLIRRATNTIRRAHLCGWRVSWVGGCRESCDE